MLPLSLYPLQASGNFMCHTKVTSASNELIFSKKLKVIYLHKKIHTIQTHNNYKNSQIEPNYFPSWQNQSKIAVE